MRSSHRRRATIIQASRNFSMGDQPDQVPSASRRQKGGIGYVLLWLLGVPLPVLLVFALLRGCA
jgi:hypothetical protein